jgi:hypothetical protein
MTRFGLLHPFWLDAKSVLYPVYMYMQLGASTAWTSRVGGCINNFPLPLFLGSDVMRKVTWKFDNYKDTHDAKSGCEHAVQIEMTRIKALLSRLLRYDAT